MSNDRQCIVGIVGGMGLFMSMMCMALSTYAIYDPGYQIIAPPIPTLIVSFIVWLLSLLFLACFLKKAYPTQPNYTNAYYVPLSFTLDDGQHA